MVITICMSLPLGKTSVFFLFPKRREKGLWKGMLRHPSTVDIFLVAPCHLCSYWKGGFQNGNSMFTQPVGRWWLLSDENAVFSSTHALTSLICRLTNTSPHAAELCTIYSLHKALWPIQHKSVMKDCVIPRESVALSNDHLMIVCTKIILLACIWFGKKKNSPSEMINSECQWFVSERDCLHAIACPHNSAGGYWLHTHLTILAIISLERTDKKKGKPMFQNQIFVDI